MKVLITAPWFQSKRSKSFRIPSLEEIQGKIHVSHLMGIAECTNDLKGGVKTTQVCKSNRNILKTQQLTHDSIWPNIRRFFWSLAKSNANYRIDIALASPLYLSKMRKILPKLIDRREKSSLQISSDFFAFPLRHQERKVCIVTRYLDTKTQPIL